MQKCKKKYILNLKILPQKKVSFQALVFDFNIDDKE